jgi:hypothetical protein
MGGMAPDIEHILSKLGTLTDSQKVFPTHGREIIPHGQKTRNPALQLLALSIGIVLAELGARRHAVRRSCSAGGQEDANADDDSACQR